MGGWGWLILIALSYMGISIFIAYMKNKKFVDLENEIPIYWTDQLGRNFIVLGSVSSAGSKYDAEISLRKQAKKLNADAIICAPLGVSNYSGGGVSSSKGFDGKMKINDTSYIGTSLHYNGSAIRFKENTETSNISQANNSLKQANNSLEQTTNKLEEKLTKLENDTIIEIEKQKKLLENEIISEEECKERIALIKKQLVENKETIKYQLSEEVIKNEIKLIRESKYNSFVQEKLLEGFEYNEKTKVLTISSSPMDYIVQQTGNGDCNLVQKRN